MVLLGGRFDFAKSELTSSSNGSATKQSDNAGTGRAGLVYLFDNGFAPHASVSQSFTPQSGADKNGNAFEPTECEEYPGRDEPDLRVAERLPLQRAAYRQRDPAIQLVSPAKGERHDQAAPESNALFFRKKARIPGRSFVLYI